MSLYTDGLKSQSTSVRIGDAGGASTTSEVGTVAKQKKYVSSRNGYMATFRDVKDLPYTNVDDAELILRFWISLIVPGATLSMPLKNSIAAAKQVITRTSKRMTPGDTYLFWKSIYRVENETKNQVLPTSDMVKMSRAIVDSITENYDDAIARIKVTQTWMSQGNTRARTLLRIIKAMYLGMKKGINILPWYTQKVF